MYSPIIIFAFNRPDALRATLEALGKCPESKDSEAYIFVDGPRISSLTDEVLVAKTRQIAAGCSLFRNVRTFFSDTNKGLGNSIIHGVTRILKLYKFAIVLEDDLIVMPNFLAFMNQALETYSSDKSVFSICGYSNKVRIPDDYKYDAYFCTRSSSWGWATWKDRWESVDWSFKKWEEWRNLKKSFNKWGGSDCFSMLKNCKDGKNQSWAIRFCFNQFLQNKLSLFPTKSLVINDGFDGNGTNCKKYSRFVYELMDNSKDKFVFPKKIQLIPSFKHQALKYHSISMRLWSKFMYLIKS